MFISTPGNYQNTRTNLSIYRPKKAYPALLMQDFATRSRLTLSCRLTLIHYNYTDSFRPLLILIGFCSNI